MHLTRIALWCVCSLLLISSAAADASCSFHRLSFGDAEQMYAGADLVFVGTLKGRSKKKLPAPSCEHRGSKDAADQSCMGTEGEGWPESPRSPRFPPPSPWVGEFAMERYYKGEPPSRMEVRIQEWLEVGERFLVYAVFRNGELDSDGACNGSAFAYTARVQEHLSYLDTLPAAGTGGVVDLHVRNPDGRSASTRTLDFVGPEGYIGLRYDYHESGEYDPSRSAALPPGRYRLLNAAEPGYRFRCRSGRSTSCDEFLVQDRAVEAWSIDIEPLAFVRVGLRDAFGELTVTDAQFEFIDAFSGETINLHRASPWSAQGKSIAGRMTPGRVVPALILTSAERLGKFDPNPGRRRIFSEGKSDWRQAQAYEIRPGDNRIEFLLPTERQPVPIRINLSEVQSSRDSFSTSAWLNIWTEDGFERDRPFECRSDPGTGSCNIKFLGIPGQFWSLMVSGYRIFDDDQAAGRDEQIIEITDPAVLELKVTAKR